MCICLEPLQAGVCGSQYCTKHAWLMASPESVSTPPRPKNLFHHWAQAAKLRGRPWGLETDSSLDLLASRINGRVRQSD